MPPLRDLLLGALVPALIAGLVLAFALQLHRARAHWTWGAASGFALALGYAFGQVAIVGWPVWPIPGTRDWLAISALIAAVYVALESSLPLQGGTRWIARLTPCLFAAGLELRPLLKAITFSALFTGSDDGWGGPSQVDAWSSLAQFIGLGLAIALTWRIIELLGSLLSSATACAGLALVLVATSRVLLDAAAASLAQLAGVVCACLGGAMTCGILRPDRKFASGLAGPLACLFCGLLTEASRWGDASVASVLLTWSAPAAFALAAVITQPEASRLRRFAILFGALALPLALALWIGRPVAANPYG